MINGDFRKKKSATINFYCTRVSHLCCKEVFELNVSFQCCEQDTLIRLRGFELAVNWRVIWPCTMATLAHNHIIIALNGAARPHR